MDIDYKKPKINVYTQNDIFTRCMNPKEYELMKENANEQEKESPDVD